MKKLSIILVLALLALACSLVPQVQPQAETQPAPPTTQPTLKPTVPEKISPQPGATFSGPIQITGEHASSGTLTFIISADGHTVTLVNLGLTDLKCTGVSIGETNVTITTDKPVTDTLDLTVNGIGDIQGRFDSSTSASGTIHLKVIVGMGSSSTCDMGTWPWSAEAD